MGECGGERGACEDEERTRDARRRNHGWKTVMMGRRGDRKKDAYMAESRYLRQLWSSTRGKHTRQAPMLYTDGDSTTSHNRAVSRRRDGGSDAVVMRLPRELLPLTRQRRATPAHHEPSPPRAQPACSIRKPFTVHRPSRTTCASAISPLPNYATQTAAPPSNLQPPAAPKAPAHHAHRANHAHHNAPTRIR